MLEQRSHFKLDLHRYNTKQALKGKPALSEEEWERVVEKLEENEEEEISGSEDEESEEEEGVIKLEGEPRLLLESGDSVLAIHRCLVANVRDVPVDQVVNTHNRKLIIDKKCLLSGNSLHYISTFKKKMVNHNAWRRTLCWCCLQWERSGGAQNIPQLHSESQTRRKSGSCRQQEQGS